MVVPVRSLHHLQNKPHFVYEFYDSDGDPVYVGYTVHLADRLRTHMGSEMWREVVEVHTMRYPDKREAQDVEARLIRELQPRWNFTHTEQASEAARERWRKRRARQEAAPSA